MSFSIARLEGRALEHAISQQSGHGVRMKDPSSGKFVCICTAQTKAIRKYMKERVQTLVKDMASQGLHFAAGEAPVRLEDGEVKSVDVRCWLSSRQTTFVHDLLDALGNSVCEGASQVAKRLPCGVHLPA